MAAWLPAVKLVLPYITQIVTAAMPAFTQKTDKAGAEEIIPSQISELQEAVTHNAESLKLLATQLQEVIGGLDTEAAKMEKELAIIKRLSLSAIILSLAAIILWLVTWIYGP